MNSEEKKRTIKEKLDNETKRLEGLKPLENDPFSSDTGVLLSDKIRYLAKEIPEESKIIRPFDEKNLKPASYELTVGDEYYLGGKYHFLSKASADKVSIPPFQVAVIKTTETVCIPRFLIARWNLRVRFAYEGLLWVGGPQVDPGYKGHLFCPLYNLSDKSVNLSLGEPIAIMDFVKTTKFNQKGVDQYVINKHKPEEYTRYPKRIIIEKVGDKKLKSALFTKAGRRLDKFEEDIGKTEGRLSAFTTITFATLAIVFSALTLLPQGGGRVELSYPFWGGLIMALFVFVVLLSLLQYFGIRKPSFKRFAQIGLGINVLFGLVLIIFITSQHNVTKEIEKRLENLEKRLESSVVE